MSTDDYCRECGGPYWSKANEMSKPHYPVCSENHYRDSDRMLGIDARQYRSVYGHRYTPDPPLAPLAPHANHATGIKAVLAEPRPRPRLSAKAGDPVEVEHLDGVAVFVKMSPDHQWCIVRYAGADRWVHPARVTVVEEQPL